MTSVSERTQYVTWIREAKESGARLPLACEEAGISLRTYKRWYQNGKVLADKRPDAVRTEPANKLSAAELLQRTLLRENCLHTGLVLHSDNGAPMKSQTMRAKAYELGVTTSYSRPRVSNDNPFAESLFRTCKYRPEWPSSGFKSLDEARQWVLKFTRWYNYEHKHSQLHFVTPHQRHTGQDKAILAQRKRCMEAAKAANPSRWGKRDVRNCEPVGPTTLNPEKKPVKQEEKQAA